MRAKVRLSLPFKIALILATTVVVLVMLSRKYGVVKRFDEYDYTLIGTIGFFAEFPGEILFEHYPTTTAIAVSKLLVDWLSWMILFYGLFYLISLIHKSAKYF